jgi:aspartate aminotransferase
LSIAEKIREAQSRASWIRKMFEDGDRLKRERGADNVFDLTLGNPCLDPPDEFFQSARDVLEEPPAGRYGYMSNAGYPETREAVAAHLCSERGGSLEGKHIFMTCGAAGGLNVVFKTLLNPGEEVILLAPFFPEYRFYVDNHGGTFRIVETRKDFSLDNDAIEAALTPATKVVLLNSPNNPTGRMYDEESLRGLSGVLERAQKRFNKSLYLVSDEPYGDLLFDGGKLPDLLKFHTNTILVNSYSKSLSIPGERLGYIAVHPQADDLAALLEGLSFCNRTLGYVNAPATAQRIIQRIPASRVDPAQYEKRRDLLCEGMAKAGYTFQKPDGAFYLFPESPVPDDVSFVASLLKEGVLVVPGAGFGRAGHFRIAFCVEERTLERSLPVFARVLDAASR